MPLINEQVIHLVKQGPSAWNARSQQLRAAKQELLETGTWRIDSQDPYEVRGENEPTRQWLHDASILARNYPLPTLDFSECLFAGPVDFYGADLSGTTFKGAEFDGRVRFDKAILTRTSFEGAVFHDTVFFEGCSSEEGPNFSTAVFRKGAWFQGVSLKSVSFWRCESDGAIYFNSAVFHVYANIEWCDFRGFTSFRGARFLGDVNFLTTAFQRASFDVAAFEGDANFRNVSAEDLTFERASFAGSIDFRGLRVGGTCSFRSARSTGDVDLANACFNSPPDLTLSTFRREPRLESIRIRRSLIGFYLRPPTGIDLTERRPPVLGFWIDEDAPAKLRELKKIAASTNDAVNEQEFHAQEIRASRFVTDWPIPWKGKPVGGISRFWFGLAYGLLSDFGRSVLRPGLWWLALVVLCAIIYLGQNSDVRLRRHALIPQYGPSMSYLIAAYKSWRDGQSCVVGLPKSVTNLTSAVQEAFQVSVMNAVVFGDGAADGFRRAYGCLYGLENTAVPNSPPIMSPIVNWVGRTQRVLSVMLIFLFGLGLRNMLKMK